MDKVVNSNELKRFPIDVEIKSEANGGKDWCISVLLL